MVIATFVVCDLPQIHAAMSIYWLQQSLKVVAFNFIILPKMLTLLSCCGKTFTIGIHGQSG